MYNSNPPPVVYLSAADVVRRSKGAVTYNRVLTACKNGEITYQSIGPSFCILEQDADEWLKKQAALADPDLVESLRARIASLETQVIRLGGKV